MIRWLASSLTDHDRHGIAVCDYGDEVEAHRAAIEEILRSGRVVNRFDWVPREVLALTRWTDIDPADQSAQALVLHRQRLFATAALMAQITLDPLDEDATENTLFGFVDSAMALGQQPLALGMLRWIGERLDAQAVLEAQAAKESGETDFVPADVTGREVAYLPLAILILDRSQDQPSLSSGAVVAAVELARTLDHPYLEAGAPLPRAALFHDPSEGMREKDWRRLLRAAIQRERARGPALQGPGPVEALVEWWKLALATGNR